MSASIADYIAQQGIGGILQSPMTTRRVVPLTQAAGGIDVEHEGKRIRMTPKKGSDGSLVLQVDGERDINIDLSNVFSGANTDRNKPPDMPGMLMVKNRGKNRGKTGENRAETGPRRRKPGPRQTRRSRAEPGF